MLQERAMLVNLNIRGWSARKRDKNIGKEVERAHQATDAGNFNKLLIDKTALKPLENLSGVMRDTHYKMTLPWGDNGDRLLPATMYFDYVNTFRDLRSRFDSAVRDFVTNYPTYKQAARKRLGSMYDPEDYPDVSVIAQKFSAKPSFLPVPDAKDFRVDLGEEAVGEIRKDIEKEMANRQLEATKDLWSRLKDVVSRIHERLSDPEAIFRDSLIENAQTLCALAQKLNFTNDPDLEHTRKDIEHRLCRVAPQRLRDDKTVRALVADAAADILKTFPIQ